MTKGRILLLNGPSSAGKTTLAWELQTNAPSYWYWLQTQIDGNTRVISRKCCKFSMQYQFFIEPVHKSSQQPHLKIRGASKACEKP